MTTTTEQASWYKPGDNTRSRTPKPLAWNKFTNNMNPTSMVIVDKVRRGKLVNLIAHALTPAYTLVFDSIVFVVVADGDDDDESDSRVLESSAGMSISVDSGGVRTLRRTEVNSKRRKRDA